MSGTLALREAIKHVATKHAVREQTVRRGTVMSTNPLTVSVFGYTHPLVQDNDFDLSGWAKLYDSLAGFRDGDLVLMHLADAVVLFDVVTDTTVTFNGGTFTVQTGSG